MKKLIIFIISIILLTIVLFSTGLYTLHRYYFEGAVKTYMNVQGISKNKIANRKVSFNWVNMGQWEEIADIKDDYKTYNYRYFMNWKSKKVYLIIYNNRADVSDSKKLNYPPLNNK